MLTISWLVTWLDKNKMADGEAFRLILEENECGLFYILQVAMATGQVLFHRFFYSKSFVKHSFEVRRELNFMYIIYIFYLS